jgi:hypothetical protein
MHTHASHRPRRHSFPSLDPLPRPPLSRPPFSKRSRGPPPPRACRRVTSSTLSPLHAMASSFRSDGSRHSTPRILGRPPPCCLPRPPPPVAATSGRPRRHPAAALLHASSVAGAPLDHIGLSSKQPPAVISPSGHLHVLASKHPPQRAPPRTSGLCSIPDCEGLCLFSSQSTPAPPAAVSLQPRPAAGAPVVSTTADARLGIVARPCSSSSSATRQPSRFVGAVTLESVPGRSSRTPPPRSPSTSCPCLLCHGRAPLLATRTAVTCSERRRA